MDLHIIQLEQHKSAIQPSCSTHSTREVGGYYYILSKITPSGTLPRLLGWIIVGESCLVAVSLPFHPLPHLPPHQPLAHQAQSHQGSTGTLVGVSWTVETVCNGGVCSYRR